MAKNPILTVLSVFLKRRVKCLLMGGQACIFYGAAEFTRDTDFCVLCDDKNLERIKTALRDLKAVQVFFPPLEVRFLRKGHACHFVCGTNDNLLGINQTAHDLLMDAGNSNLAFVTFEGGHEYLEENVENMYLWMRNFVKSDRSTGIKRTGIIQHDGLRIECIPNPVTATSKLVYSGTENTDVSISIYDMVGRCVDEVEDAVEISGVNSVAFDAAGLTPGIYLVRMQSGHGVAKSKITVLKL